MTNIDRKSFDVVRKVRLKTASGVMTRCYTSSKSPRETDDSPETSGSKESGFSFLPELIAVQDRLSIGESSLLDLQPDFSAYNFWLSETRCNLTHGVDFSDAFSCGALVETLDHASASEPILGLSPDDRQCFTTEPDPHSQNSMNSSDMVAQEINYRERCWNFPLLLEEDIFDCTTNWNLLAEVSDRDSDGENTFEDYLVESSPQSSNVQEENLDSNLLVYAPNRYVEEEARIFLSSPADLGIQSPNAVQKRSRKSGKTNGHGRCRFPRTENSQSMSVEGRNSAVASFIDESDVDDVAANELMIESGEKARSLLRVNQFVNQRRRRFSAPGLKGSRFLEPTTKASSDRRSPTQGNRELKLCRQSSSPIRTSHTSRRLLEPECSNSTVGEVDRNCHKSPSLKAPRRHLILLDSIRAKSVRKNSVTSIRGSTSPSNASSSRVRASGLKLRSEPRSLMKKRRRYGDMCDGSDNRKIESRLYTESQLQGSPKKIKFAKTSPPRASPAVTQFRRSPFGRTSNPRVSPAAAQFRRSPWDNRKKVRTFRRRPQDSPKSAKKLHFYGKIVQGGPLPGKQRSLSPDQLEVSREATTSTGKPLRRRPLLPQISVEVLQSWVDDNLQDPYPSRREKEDLMFETGLKMSQIENWLGNARQKLKFKSRAVKDICNESSSSPRKRSKRKRSYPLKMRI